MNVLERWRKRLSPTTTKPKEPSELPADQSYEFWAPDKHDGWSELRPRTHPRLPAITPPVRRSK